MFFKHENVNDVEALVPAERAGSTRTSAILSSNIAESTAISEKFISDCEYQWLWWESI